METPALDATVLETLVSAAVAAPSIHNTQPWRFRLDPVTSTIEVHAAVGRVMRQADPDERALHVSVGASLFNLRVAVAHFGWEPVVRLLPRPSEPDWLASVRLAGPIPGGAPGSDDLYEAVWRRHSSRFPFSTQAVPPKILTEICDAAAAEGAEMVLSDPDETRRILELTAEAERFASSDPARRTESRFWVRGSGREGLPGAVLGPRDSDGRLPVRDFSPLNPQYLQPSEPFEPHPVIAVLSTEEDQGADWLRAGEALEHALLVATTHHVRASLFHQAVEWPDIRWLLRDPRGGTRHVHMLVRFGFGPEGPASPRRSIRDVLDTTARE